MQSQAGGDASVASNGDGPKSLSIEDAVGNAFLQLLAETDSQAQDQRFVLQSPFFAGPPGPFFYPCPGSALDVRRRKEEPPGTYDGFVDLAASAAVRVLVYGPNSPDESRNDPTPLTLYRRMLSLVKRASSGAVPNSDPRRQSADENITHGLNGHRDIETITRQELLDKAYDSGHAAGYEAGVQAEAAKRQTASEDTEEAYTQGFAAGQRRLMNSEIAFAFARGQQAEQQRIRTRLEEEGKQRYQATEILEELLGSTTESPDPVRHTRPASASIPDASTQQSRQYSSRGSEISHASPPARLPEAAIASEVQDSSLSYSPQTEPQTRTPAPTSEWATMPRRRRVGRPRLLPDDGDGRNTVATCVFCGVQLSQNSVLRHKRRHHPAELAARKHNFSPPGDPNAFTENIKYIKRMPIDLQISIIAEAAQQLNAVKLRIQDLEAQHRRREPSYVSRHGLPDLRQLHESRPPVLSAIFRNRGRLPYIVQELRQLTRARGMRSQMRDDEGTWWEVADDLEAGLTPSSKLSRSVIALPPPGNGPTVPLHLNTFSEAPNMNDPSWRPQHALPFQTGWDVTGPDDNPVWTRVATGAQQSESGPAEPAVKLEAEDDEEDGGYQELMAEISRRVQDDKAQSEWDQSSSDGGGSESADAEDNAAQGTPDQTRRGNPQLLKRSTTTASPPRNIKRHRAA
ncbi:hypothetical protein INS49_003643 [Diaporthe citri]|uniref:uncharacterized protein n=1 Tax=Diaporthe citri TaxID=83186 RepID=UPI001C7E6D8E|nr:uncharacterized protein INS49_003643 [Diaporthe citri]KAG6355679.1 hypothetical protein INS49_003643 [Diaporthe citri]